jgi:hypothetical protein
MGDRAPARIAIFGPHPLLTVTIETEGDASGSISTPAARGCGLRG